MRKIAYAMLAPLVVSLILAFTPTASANHLFATTMDPPAGVSPDYQINILGPCVSGVYDLIYPADTGFFVAHGLFSFRILEDGSFVPSSWQDVSPEGKRAFMSKATTFELWIDDELQKSSMRAPIGWSSLYGMVGKNKVFVIEDHDGLRGTHNFVGRWFLDASFIGGEFGEPWLFFECPMTVEFD